MKSPILMKLDEDMHAVKTAKLYRIRTVFDVVSSLI